MKVLYVEDDALDADLTRRELSRRAAHIELQIARTQKEALQFLEQPSNYDLVLTDLNLPDGGGFALLAHVRERGLPLSVVVVTGQGGEETAVAALKSGADDYLVKRPGYLTHLALTLESSLLRYRAEVARRARPLKVLYAEQNPADKEQVRKHFEKHAPHIYLDFSSTAADLMQRLPEQKAVEYDALLIDYQLHGLNALEVLKDLRQLRKLDLPIIFVTGHGDQEIAAQALRLGASDYVVKSPGYIYQLPGLLENAYHFVQLRREQEALRASEKRFRALIENSADGVLLLDRDGIAMYASPASERILGEATQWIVGRHVLESSHPEDTQSLLAFWEQVVQSPGNPLIYQMRIRRKKRDWIWLEMTGVNSLDDPAIQGVVVNFRDITERKNAEEHIQRQLQRLRALRTVDMAIASSLDLRLTLSVLLDHVVTQLTVDAADVMLYHHASQTLVYGDGRGFRSSQIEHTRLRLGEGLAGRAADERRTVQDDNLSVNPGDSVEANWHQSEAFLAYYGTPLIAKGQVKGVLEVYQRKVYKPDAEWLDFFETLAGQAAIAIDNAELFEDLQLANEDLIKAYDSTLEGWVRALDLRDNETEDHTMRVVETTLQLSRIMGISEDDMVHVRRGALLHDIGKIGIPDEILKKTDPLTDEEWDVVRKHPNHAYRWLSPIEYLCPALDIPYCHHEKWDGTGYPQCLKGEQIPLAARIFAVVDVWDALINDRAYRRAWGKEKAMEYISFLSGTHFDPQVVKAFLTLMGEEPA